MILRKMMVADVVSDRSGDATVNMADSINFSM